MNYQTLIIKQLSRSGEVLRTISCASGFVTVFRSHHYADLKPYQHALAGIAGADRFIISLDETNYEPSLCTLIGFGERFESTDGTSRQFLERAGVPSDGVLSILAMFNLEKCVDVLCTELSPGEGRMIRLSALTYARSQVVILNDPFESIPNQWRDRFAENITLHARTIPAIVLVTSLSSRPESWIDNEFIVRTQVGETRQKTIGFGSAPSEMRQMIDQVREEMRSEEEQASGVDVPLPLNPQKDSGAEIRLPGDKQATLISWEEGAPEGSDDAPSTESIPPPPSRSLPWIRVASGGLLILLVSGSYLFIVQEKHKTPSVATLENVVTPARQTKDTATAPSIVAANLKVTPTAILSTATPVAEKLILDDYPSEIRTSIIHLVEGISPPIGSESDAPAEEAPKPALVKSVGKSANLLQMLENANGSTAPAAGGEATSEIADAPAPVNGNDDQMSWEERREVMRQKFLESIRAASEQPQ